jgi:hypothetical protein
MKSRSLGHAASGLAVFSCLLWLCCSAPAQQQEPQRYTGQGKIQELGDGIVSIVDGAGQVYLVAFDRRSGYQVQVVGSADVSYLTPGMMVRFTADLNEKGVAQEPITRLSVVEVSEVVRPGLQAQVAIGQEPKRNEPQTYVIVGQIRSVRRGQLQVTTPDGAVKAKLDPDAQVEIDVSDYRLARKDDTLEVELGYLLAPPQGEQPGQVVAQKVIIELDPKNPLVGKGKKARPNKKDKSADKPSAGDETENADKDATDRPGRNRPDRNRRGKKNGELAGNKPDEPEAEPAKTDKPAADKALQDNGGEKPNEPEGDKAKAGGNT